MKVLKVGELAKKTAVSVRTLHHYDEIGLLKATGVTSKGHRFYQENDVKRLQQILSLKDLGLSLSQILTCLNEDKLNLGDVLSFQKEAVHKKIEDLKRMERDLAMMLERLTKNKDIKTEELLLFMQRMKEMEQMYYTPEQLKKLKERYEQYPEDAKRVEDAWPILFNKFEEALKKGLSVSEDSVQELAKEAQHYINLFTGGDKEIEKNLDKAYKENQESALKVWGVSKEVFEYATKARTFLKSKKN